MMKLHGKGKDGVMALCDPELLGMTLESEEVDLVITRSFYEGDIVEEEMVLRLIPMLGSINAIGDTPVSILKDAGYVDEENIRYFESVPHIQIYNMIL
jgi:hypothetical protein